MKAPNRSLHTYLLVVISLVLSWIAWGPVPRLAAGDTSAGDASAGDASAGELKLYPHVFVCDTGDSSAHRVMVVGDFNGWSHDATPMTRGNDGVSRVSVEMPEGVHMY